MSNVEKPNCQAEGTFSIPIIVQKNGRNPEGFRPNYSNDKWVTIFREAFPKQENGVSM